MFFRPLFLLFALFLLSTPLSILCGPKEEGEAFLRTNGALPDVTTLPSGVQYKILTEGPSSGASPSRSDSVTVHYAGRLINGQEFDSSIKRNSPATFGVTQVIAGWTEILQLMSEGDKYEVYIPADKAYGSRGYGSTIPGDSTLIFTIQLIEVVGKKKKEL